MAGIKISDCLCIELCAGSAGLSAALRRTGFQVIPVDHKSNRHHPKVACTCINLAHPSAFSILRALIDNSGVVYVHAAPPCGTASRAREKPISAELLRSGAPCPRPLRSDEHPAGLPDLTPNERVRVEAANKIYDLVADIILYLIFRAVLFSVENPINSLFWKYGRMPEIRSKPEVESNPFQACMHGGERDKWSDWTATKGLFTSLRMACDKSHTHRPWGFVDSASSWEFATAEEAEYPRQLCDTAAHLVLDHCLNSGAVAVPDDLRGDLSADQQNRLTKSRVFRQAQGKKIPPIVSEFKQVVELSNKPGEDDKTCKLIRQFNRGAEGSNLEASGKVFIVGEYRNPTEFLEAAISAGHPLDMRTTIPDVTLRAIFDILVLGPVQISKKRIATLHEVRTMAAELEESEKSLEKKTPDQLRAVLKGKRLGLMRKLLTDNDFPDKHLVDEIRKGFRMTGVGTKSGDLPPRIVSATITPNDLKARARVAQNLAASTTKSSGEADLDKAVYSQTLEEVEKGWLSGPFRESELENLLGEYWVPSRRFGIKQGSKVRAIDDASEPGINDCFTSTEKLQLMGVDFAAEVCSVVMSSIAGSCVNVKISGGQTLSGVLSKDWGGTENALEWLGRTLDLKSAYKQLAINPEDQWCSVLAVFNPTSGQVDYFVSRALLFGATSSVYAFNRAARAIWFLASKCFSLVCGQFYDDFPCVEPKASSGIARSTFHQFLDLLGWKWSGGDKDSAFNQRFKMLGVAFDLTGMREGKLEIKNTVERISSIRCRIDEIINKGSISTAESSELLGRLQFASSQIMGRTIMPTTAILSLCASYHKPAWPLIRGSLVGAVKNLEMGQPRTLCSQSSGRRPFLIFTDGAWEGGIGSWGLFIHDCEDGSRSVASGVVPDRIIRFWKETVGEQLICQIELWPILLAKKRLSGLLAGRKIIWFVDNEAAKETIVRGYSGSAASAAIAQEYFDEEALVPTNSWCTRVPTYSNPADMPSRNEAVLCAQIFGAKVIELGCFTDSEIEALISRTKSFLL